MTKTIVTGGSGFIGSHLMKKLPDALHLPHEEIIGGHSWDAEQLFFLSTYGNMASHTNHYEMVKANVIDLLSVLKSFTGHLIFMSSSSVTLPVQTPYSRSKRAAEEILQALPQLKSCIVRPYSVTGVGEQEEHLIPTLIRSCMEGEEMMFNPFPVHDFVDVGDVVDVLIDLAENEVSRIVELGSGIPHSNQEIRELVEHYCQKKANIKGKGLTREYDNTEWYCRKPRALKKSVAESISEMVEAYKRERS